VENNEKKKEYPYLPISRRIMGELWDEVGAFNRVEKYFRESDNRKIRSFHHRETTSFVLTYKDRLLLIFLD